MKNIKTLAFSIFGGLLALTVVTFGTPISAEAATEVAAPTAIQAPADEITDQEALQFMVEEEKLARDVYLTLYEEWNSRIFQNIAGAEQTHMDAIRTLFTTYDVDDPTEGNDIGVFENDELRALYVGLVETGSQSLADALKVGAAIEEIDILDLEEYIAATDNADIELVYENLLKGSENHLRAFVSTLEQQTGEVYVSQYMVQADYDAIINADTETGGNGQGGSNSGDGNNNGGGGRGK